MPTHVEIGRIPPTPVDPPTVYSSETIPRTHRKSAKMEKKTDRSVSGGHDGSGSCLQMFTRERMFSKVISVVVVGKVV